MLFDSLTDSYKNNQSVFDCKSVFKTPWKIEHYGE